MNTDHDSDIALDVSFYPGDAQPYTLAEFLADYPFADEHQVDRLRYADVGEVVTVYVGSATARITCTNDGYEVAAAAE